jgi:predicted RNA binding protein with dsRBD fold (UPF0201 family)
MENLVLQAIGNSEVEKINKIKRNKEFLKRLIGDLQQVYTLYVSNVDNQNSTTYRIKKQSNYIDTIFFSADENGCRFRTKILGYRKCSEPSWELGWIVEKYDTCKGDANFMLEGTSTHGHVEVLINFTDVSGNLMDIIKDITRILDHEKVSKKF